MISKTIVLITGGNAGIGYEIVKKIAIENPDTHHVLMGTRSLAKGEAAHKSLGSPKNVTPVQLDIVSDDSIATLQSHVSSTYGRLDVLIHNAATAGRDADLMPEGKKIPGFRAEGKSIREIYAHVYNTNIISAAVLTESFESLLHASSAPKVIFITSTLGSIGSLVKGFPLVGAPWYNSSKSAINYLTVYYARKFPKWRVNAVCPGLNSTGLNEVPLSDETHPRNGAIRAVQLVLEKQEGEGTLGKDTATYSNKDQGIIEW